VVLQTPRPVAQPIPEDDNGAEPRDDKAAKRRAIEPNTEISRKGKGKQASCNSCRILKVRCNKELPCSQCTTNDGTCEYERRVWENLSNRETDEVVLLQS